jgi:hypothetical protein
MLPDHAVGELFPMRQAGSRAKRPQPTECPLLVGSDQARILRHISREDRREPAFDGSWPCGLHAASLHRQARIKQKGAPGGAPFRELGGAQVSRLEKRTAVARAP